MAAPRTIVIPAVKRHTASIICVHGLGDSGAGWSWLAENWRRRGQFEDVSFIFPSAPPIPITVNFGMRMPGWYDIINFDQINRSEDEQGIMRSRQYLHGLIRGEIEKGIPARRVILGGFSQGGAMAIFSGPTYPQRLCGVFGLSCYQLMQEDFDALRKDDGQELEKPPIFMGHGKEDPLVKVEWGRKTAKDLEERGFNVSWNEYAGLVHSADPEEIDQLEAWIKKRLDEQPNEDGGGKSAGL